MVWRSYSESLKRRLQTEEMPFAVPQLSEPSMKKESGGAGLLAEEGRREGKDGRMEGWMKEWTDRWMEERINEVEMRGNSSWATAGLPPSPLPPSLSPPSLTPSLSHSRPANLETTTTAFHWLWHPGASGGWGSVGQRGSWPGMDVGLVSSQQGATKKEPLLLVQK